MKRLNDGLTEKEMMFCEEYIIDMNATHVAIRAGYSEDSAKSIGYHLRQRPQVDAYIFELLDKRSLRLRITAEEVLMELAKIAFSEPESASPTPKCPKGDLNAEQAGEGSLETDVKGEEDEAGEAPVRPAPRYSSATMYRVTDIDPVTGQRTVRYFSLTAKIAALKLLGLHLGLFKDKKGLVKKPTIIFPREDYPPADRLAA